MVVSIIIPTYNERDNIKILIPKIKEIYIKHNIDGKIIIIDDSSPDGTTEVAKCFARDDDRISVINRLEKRGIGSAYKEGFNLAISLGFDGVIQMDADLSHNPSSIPFFLRKLDEGYDLVIGSRYIHGGEIPKWTIIRRLVSKGANFLTRFLLNLKTRDVTSGYRAYSIRALKKINLSKVKSDGYAFQVEMTRHCERACLKICEIPITFTDRSLGKSKLGTADMLKFLRSIIDLSFKNYRD